MLATHLVPSLIDLDSMKLDAIVTRALIVTQQYAPIMSVPQLVDVLEIHLLVSQAAIVVQEHASVESVNHLATLHNLLEVLMTTATALLITSVILNTVNTICVHLHATPLISRDHTQTNVSVQPTQNVDQVIVQAMNVSQIALPLMHMDCMLIVAIAQ